MVFERFLSDAQVALIDISPSDPKILQRPFNDPHKNKFKFHPQLTSFVAHPVQ